MTNSWCLLLSTVAGLMLLVSSEENITDCAGQNDKLSPTVYGDYEEFLAGENFTINCNIFRTPDSAVDLAWELPDSVKGPLLNYTNKNDPPTKNIYNNITIINAQRNHAGSYTCVANNHCGQGKKTFQKKFLEYPYLRIKAGDRTLVETKQPHTSQDMMVYSYPPANFSLYKNNLSVQNDGKYNIRVTPRKGYTSVLFQFHKKNIEDSGNYTIVAKNGYQTENVTFDIRFKTAPVVLSNTTVKYCDLNRTVSLQCEVTGYPLPVIKWITDSGIEMDSTKVDQVAVYKEKAVLDVPCDSNKIITCKATNNISSNQHTTKLRVDELPDGFGIRTKTGEENFLWIAEQQEATLICVASLFKFSNVTWELNGTELTEIVEHTKNQFSHVAKLKINRTSTSDSGTYVCSGVRLNGTMEKKEIEIIVNSLSAPQITFSTDFNGNVKELQSIHMNCEAYGVPQPTIEWFKDGKKIIQRENGSNIELYYYNVDHKTVNSTISIDKVKVENIGTYECFASNEVDQVKKSAELILEEAAYVKYVIAIGVIFIVLIAVVIFLTIKLRRDKAKRAWLRRELAAAGLLYFNEGQSKSLNPDLGIDEQADLLPYDEKFEFPPDKLEIGHQLGAGAFGVVYKAQARGIIDAEETTPVAVKMVKKTADNMYIKALATELKIMVHLGKHVNIVNLLGACTKNVGKRELSVIVEYCKFGNIHNYMQRHRDVFIDQFSDNNKEKSFGKVNRGYDSSGSTGIQSDYGTANTQDTVHTFLTNNTNQNSRKTSESYVQPEWRSNYVSDYSYDGRSPRPLTSRDLLAWAFQIARGMEYLANRKILHGDLAARNILLAEDNIVKICDFGLARSIYKNDEYQKKENSLLPVKWLAIECMTDRIFSTQSDVWSFGIVLWELFTLAKTPYPNMDPHHLLPFLREGHRLEKPDYSDDRIYSVMKRCWEEKPTMRPSFTKLQEDLGTFLEENVRNHYVDLNNAYIDMNVLPDGQEDYLAMVTAPDYNNMVTPSPHHYVNSKFFPPTPTKVDDEGYLQMTPRTSDIFSPKPTAMKFDFEPRKLNSRPSEASSVGSELTPMLSLNNMPRSGSDSDHEGNVLYPTGCPTINEESIDDVFLSKQNNETSNQNARNAHNTAVTNPTYITFDMDDEKKSKDIISYVNIKPNGLVK